MSQKSQGSQLKGSGGHKAQISGSRVKGLSLRGQEVTRLRYQGKGSQLKGSGGHKAQISGSRVTISKAQGRVWQLNSSCHT